MNRTEIASSGPHYGARDRRFHLALTSRPTTFPRRSYRHAERSDLWNGSGPDIQTSSGRIGVLPNSVRYRGMRWLRSP